MSKMLNKRKRSSLCGLSFLQGQLGSAAGVKAPGQEQATQVTSCRAQWLSSVQNSLEYYRELERHFWKQGSSPPTLKQSPYLWLHICLDYNFLDGIILAASCLAHSETVLPRARAPLLNTGVLDTHWQCTKVAYFGSTHFERIRSSKHCIPIPRARLPSRGSKLKFLDQTIFSVFLPLFSAHYGAV